LEKATPAAKEEFYVSESSTGLLISNMLRKLYHYTTAILMLLELVIKITDLSPLL
jgi:hypothetical protein